MFFYLRSIRGWSVQERNGQRVRAVQITGSSSHLGLRKARNQKRRSRGSRWIAHRRWGGPRSAGIEEDGGSLHPAASGFHGRSSPVRLPVTRLVGGREVRWGEARGGDCLLRRSTQSANRQWPAAVLWYCRSREQVGWKGFDGDDHEIVDWTTKRKGIDEMNAMVCSPSAKDER
jgi:hypothetical protein